MNIDLTKEEIHFIIRSLVSSYAADERDFSNKDIVDPGTPGVVLGKLICMCGDNMDCYEHARKESALKTPINKKLFLGSGNMSRVEVNKLHRRLEYAINMLGGMQQNGGMGTKYDEKADIEDSNHIKDVIKDIAIALKGFYETDNSI